MRQFPPTRNPEEPPPRMVWTLVLASEGSRVGQMMDASKSCWLWEAASKNKLRFA
jgi:hypothetical protein